MTIYDVGETGGVSWIAMEWVEGRTLREALSAGPLSFRETLLVARQIAEGLAAAHVKGIVHRDLKPENVMITAEGRAKVLDFGLARVSRDEAPEGQASQVDTLEALPDATRTGTILGTVGYMSPEQASGGPWTFAPTSSHCVPSRTRCWRAAEHSPTRPRWRRSPRSSARSPRPCRRSAPACRSRCSD